MKKVKLDNFELKVVIKSLNEMRTQLLSRPNEYQGVYGPVYGSREQVGIENAP